MLLQNFKNSSFAKNVSRVFGIKTIVLVLGMLSSIVSARVLGPEGKGVFAVATALTGMGVQFGNLGMHSSNTYFLAKNKKILPCIVGNSVAVTLLVTLFAGGVFVMLWFFPNLVTIHGTILILSFVYIPVQLYNMYQENYFIALDEIKKYSVLEMLNGSLYPVLLIFIAFLGGWNLSPEVAVVLSILATCFVIVVGVVFLKKEIGGKICIDKKLFQESLPFGFKSYVSCLLTYLVLRADILMLDAFLDKSQTGLYSLAVNLADIVNMIAVSVSMLLFPKLSGMSEEREKRSFIWKTLKYMSLIMLVLIIGAAIFSEWAVLLVYGEDYRESVPAFRILMPGIFFWSLSSLLFNFFSSENRIGINISSSLVGLCVNLIFNWVLIPWYGIQGAAMASTVAYVIIFILLIYYLKKTGEGYEESKKT